MILTRFVLPFEGNNGFIGIDAGNILKPNMIYGVKNINDTLILVELGENTLPLTELKSYSITQLHFDGRNFLTNKELGNSNK